MTVRSLKREPVVTIGSSRTGSSCDVATGPDWPKSAVLESVAINARTPARRVRRTPAGVIAGEVCVWFMVCLDAIAGVLTAKGAAKMVRRKCRPTLHSNKPSPCVAMVCQ